MIDFSIDIIDTCTKAGVLGSRINANAGTICRHDICSVPELRFMRINLTYIQIIYISTESEDNCQFCSVLLRVLRILFWKCYKPVSIFVPYTNNRKEWLFISLLYHTY